MRALFSRYETEIRVGLLVIVVLLLMLNFSTSYIFLRVKNQITEEIDQRLSAGLNFAALYMTKNESSTVPREQLDLIRQRFDVKYIHIYELTDDDRQALPRAFSSAEFNLAELKGMHGGQQLFRASPKVGKRIGVMRLRTTRNGRIVLIAEAISPVLAIIGNASHFTLYFAVAVLLMIIPMTIGLPRLILRPFKKMHETARVAGQLKAGTGGDEVAEILQSYENIIKELKSKESELKRRFHESSTKADQLERLNRYILQSVGSGVINVDPTGKVIGYNRAAREILGYDDEFVLDKHYLVAFPYEMELGFLIEAGLERGEAAGLREIELSRSGQERLWLGIESSEIVDDTGRAVGITLLFSDLTEIKRLQFELETSRRLASLGEMTAGLAHQLRNSLAAVSGFSQLLRKKTAGDDVLSDIAESIRAEAATSAEMVSRFLSFARPLHINPEPLDLAVLVNECIQKYRGEADERGIVIRQMKTTTELPGFGDLLLLKEALGNLIDNALQAVDRDGEIVITGKAHAGGIELVVADNGPGIDESIRDDIFTPFVSSKPSGTGLGLALTHKIVHLHEGTITLEDSANGGACFRVFLPTAAPALPTASHHADAKKV